MPVAMGLFITLALQTLLIVKRDAKIKGSTLRIVTPQRKHNDRLKAVI